MGKKKKNKKNKKKYDQEAATQNIPGQKKDLIPPADQMPEDSFTGTFKEFKEMIYGLEANSGAHYFDLPFGKVMANITSKRSLKKQGFTGPGAYTWAKCQADFEAADPTPGDGSEDHPEAEEIRALFEAKYKRKEFKTHLEIDSDFDREAIDAAVALIPKKKATGVLLNTIMMQNLNMPGKEAQKVLMAIGK